MQLSTERTASVDRTRRSRPGTTTAPRGSTHDAGVPAGETMKETVIILVPSKDDHEALSRFVAELSATLERHRIEAHLVVIDDASHTPIRRSSVHPDNLESPIAVSVVRLRRNLGHQRAIAVGLAYIYERLRPVGTVVVMDGDGEDRPDDVPRLLAAVDAAAGPTIIFAERTRRSESLAFRIGYNSYRLIHRLLTGIPVRFGNFSAIPAQLLSPLVVGSELWNHYAAAVLKVGVPYRSIPTTRARRVAGESRMNVVALVVHGLSAISVFGDVIGVRLLLVGLALGTPLLAAVGVLGLTLLPNVRLPAWVLAVVGIALIVLVQFSTALLGFVFVVLGSRATTAVIPLRDYRWFVEEDEVTAQHAVGHTGERN